MVRVLVGLVLVVVATGEANARVVHEPPLLRVCPSGASWNAVMTCLQKHGKAKVVRQLARARLVSVTLTARYRTDTGLLLYVERRGEWMIGGHWQAFSQDYRLFGIEQIRTNRHVGYRIDVGSVASSRVVIDDISPVPAVIRLRRSVFCSGQRPYCSDVVTACEVLVHGRARFVFRGRLAIEEDLVHVIGDRSRAGPLCAVEKTVVLDWPIDD